MAGRFQLDGSRSRRSTGVPVHVQRGGLAPDRRSPARTRSTTTGTAHRDGGEPGQCGWLKDRFGLSWQVTPSGMDEFFDSADPEAATRAMEAMFGMKKLDLAALRAARARPSGFARTYVRVEQGDGPMSSCTRTPPTRSSTAPRSPRSWRRGRPSSATTALALTDHDGVYGSLEFAHAAKHFGVRAITGAEVTLEGAPT